MTLRDGLAFAAGNLWRMKLRTFLTVSGVVIAIAAFVSMLSFGAGNQKYVTTQFNELGLFSTMQVMPPKKSAAGDSAKTVVLDHRAIETFSTIPGVNLVYPYDAFSVTVTLGDSQVTTKAQALPTAAARTRLFSRLTAGTTFAGDSAHEAVVTDELLKLAGITSPDSAIGRKLQISVRVASIDSGLGHLWEEGWPGVVRRLKEIRFDSLRYAGYRQRLFRRELNGAMMRFADGYLNARDVVCDTLTISGVLKSHHGERVRIEPVIIPVATAARFSSGGISDNPADLITALTSGTLFAEPGDPSGKTYPQVTLDLDPRVPYAHVRDSIRALGFQTFSFAEQFKEIQRFFVYFDMVLGVVGLIALVTASLGIVNTMVMSIIERTREIGVLKSLGADDRDIRRLFLVESGAIGSLGAMFGILFGWLITRAASLVAKTLMAREGIDAIELFALPVWLVLLAFSFGLVVRARKEIT